MIIFSDSIYKFGEKPVNFDLFDTLDIVAVNAECLRKMDKFASSVISDNVSDHYAVVAVKKSSDGENWEYLSVSPTKHEAYKIYDGILDRMKNVLSISVPQAWFSVSPIVRDVRKGV